MNRLKLLVLSFAATALAACAPLPEAELIPDNLAPKVVLELTAQDELRVVTPAEEACRKAGLDVNGCYEIGRNKVAFVQFRLNNSDGWQFQRLSICLGQQEQPLPCSLGPWNRLEFLAATSKTSKFELPGGDGIIDLTALGTDLDQFFLATQNLYERWWYYQVQVCPSGWPASAPLDDPACRWNIDPPIRNKGRGRQT